MRSFSRSGMSANPESTSVQHGATVNAIQFLENTNLEEAPVRTKGLMQQLAGLVTASAEKPADLGALAIYLKDLAKNVKDLTDAVNAHLVRHIHEGGTKVTDLGTKRMEAGDLELGIRPHRTGYDPKMVEKLFRLKRVSPAHWMDEKATYAVNNKMLTIALEQGVVTEAELEACKYDITWVVETPKPKKVAALPEGDETNE